MLNRILLGPYGWKLDRIAVRWLGYSPMSRAYAKAHGLEDNSRTLLLITTGRTSGRKRSVALSYFEIDGTLLVVGSKGGAPTDPAWVNNVRANPKVRLYVDRRGRDATARIAAGEERARLWGTLAANVPTYAQFQEKIDREIPLVIFE